MLASEQLSCMNSVYLQLTERPNSYLENLRQNIVDIRWTKTLL
jgi:hypothetical protein